MNPEIIYCLRIVLAGCCGIILGAERRRHYKAAGIRVYSLISSTSALLMVLSKYAFSDLVVGDVFFLGTKGADPSRIAAGVVGGISFICIAIIYRRGSSLVGLTTSAGLLAASAVGLAIGSGLYIVGIFCAIFILLLQTVFHKLNFDNDSMATREITLRLEDDYELMLLILGEVKALGADIKGRKIIHNSDGTLEFMFILRPQKKITFKDIALIVEKYPGRVFDLNME